MIALFLLLMANEHAALGTVAATKISPDGQWRIELADYRVHQVFELFATPSIGGTRRQIGQRVPVLSDIRNDFVISSDSTKVAYEQGETASGVNHRLWSTNIDRMNGRVISQQPAQNGVGFDFPIQKISGDRVRFRSDPFVDESFAFYVTPMGGGPIQQEVFSDGFESGGVTRWN